LYPHSGQDREKSKFGLPLNRGVILELPISALGQYRRRYSQGKSDTACIDPGGAN
jgi:hypothetical protein